MINDLIYSTINSGKDSLYANVINFIIDYKVSPKDLYMKYSYPEVNIVLALSQLHENSENIYNNIKNRYGFANEISFTVNVNDLLDQQLMEQLKIDHYILHIMKTKNKLYFNTLENYYDSVIAFETSPFVIQDDRIYDKNYIYNIHKNYAKSIVEKAFDVLTLCKYDVMNKQEKLLPCAMCGCIDIILKTNFNYDSNSCKHFAFCNKCGITTKGFKERDDLIKYWNTRS